MSQAVPEGRLIVRDRQDEELAACEQLAQATHLNDRYPVYLGNSARSFLSHPNALCAWVAELDNTVIGHVALHPATSKAVMTLACDRLKVTADRIGVISRLLVSPTTARAGHRQKASHDRSHRSSSPASPARPRRGREPHRRNRPLRTPDGSASA
jgi:hypothetical protein